MYNLREMRAIDHRTTLSTRPLIARDAEEHMLGKEEGDKSVRCQQRAAIWFPQRGLCKLRMTPNQVR